MICVHARWSVFHSTDNNHPIAQSPVDGWELGDIIGILLMDPALIGLVFQIQDQSSQLGQSDKCLISLPKFLYSPSILFYCMYAYTFQFATSN